MDEATYTTYTGTVITLNDGGPYRFAPGGYPEGLMGLCFQQIGVEVPANDPAEAFQTHLLQPRDIAMRIWVCGSTTAEVTRLAAQLVAALGADVEAQQRGVFTYTADNGVTRSIRCALANVEELADWLNRFWNTSTPMDVRAQIPITLHCQSPYWYDPNEVAFVGAFTADTPVNILCPNVGRVASYPRLTYSGAVENPVVTDPVSGYSFALELTVAAGGVVYIDFDPASFTCEHTPSGGPTVNVANLQTLASRELTVAPGPDAYLTFVADAGTADISVAFNERQRGAGR